MKKKTAKYSTKNTTKKRKVLKVSMRVSTVNKILGLISGIVLIVGLVLIVRNTALYKEKCNMRTVDKTDISHRVVMNSDKKIKLPVCGTVRSSEACLYYVLNKDTYDHVAEDFFEEVAQKTQRVLFKLRLDNPLYAKVVIPPGRFAEIIVPGL